MLNVDDSQRVRQLKKGLVGGDQRSTALLLFISIQRDRIENEIVDVERSVGCKQTNSIATKRFFEFRRYGGQEKRGSALGLRTTRT